MTIRSLRPASVALVAWLFAFPDALAQSPWQVTVTPTLNPLPIGLCGAVQIQVKNLSGTDTPRNGLGARVSLADFDMTVTAPGTRSVAGQQIDASHWSVCACTGATVGAVATVTASYPSQALPGAARIPGVAFKTTATFVIAPAKGTNPPACLAPPPLPAKPAAASAPKPSAAGSNSPPGTSPPQAPTPPAPDVPATVPDFPDSTADWAALQKALGDSGWAELQNQIEAAMEETPENTDDKPPPELKDFLGPGRNHAMAVVAFKKMLPVLRHDRCVNCHADITYWDEEAYGDEPAKTATHKGGDINELPPTAKDRYGRQDVKFSPCNDCHTKAPPAWANQGPTWTGLTDYQLCQSLKRMFNGDVLLHHLRTDDLIKVGFQGQRAMEGVAPQPPPLSHAQFLTVSKEWVDRMDAMEKWPKARSEGCPRTDSWSGAIEYTYTEVKKHDRLETHGAVHIVGGLAKWNALSARQEDHSAKNCPSVYSASASGDGEMQLVTIDYTSEKGVSGFAKPDPRRNPGAAAPDSFVGLTIFPGKYALAIDLPMKGSGRYQGGGPACPGYKPYTQPFDGKIGESVDGKFDPDNPDEISGTKTYSPFPGATVTMKWQLMRLNEDWLR